MSTSSPTPSPLFTPVQLGAFDLAHRVVMATPARRRARPHGLPTALMALHHGQRASAGGLVIGEPTAVRLDPWADPHAPGLYACEQANLWRQVTDAVHGRGGTMLALLGCGETTHRAAADWLSLDGWLENFRDAAENAGDAGFDGVELHAGPGSDIDSLLRGPGADDEAAGAVVELLQALISVWGADRVGLQLAPQRPALQSLLLPHLQRLGLAYLRLPERAGLAALRGLYRGPLLAAGDAHGTEAAAAVARGELDAVVFDTGFIANPDLPERLRDGSALALPDAATLGQGGARGYTDYPRLAAAA
jgi:N-ethylmaleimide reductase